MSEILTKQRRIGERLSRYNILRFDIAALPYDGQECPSYIISLRPPHSFQSRNMYVSWCSLNGVQHVSGGNIEDVVRNYGR